MGLDTAITAAVAAAFNAVADLEVAITRTRTTGSDYDASALATTTSSADVSTTGLIGKFTELEILNSGGAIKRGDKRVIIRATSTFSDLNPATDFLTIGGTTWKVINVESPEIAGSALVLKAQVRQ